MNISIHKYLPHHPPMQMVDTITDISNTHVVTEFTVTDSCIFVENGMFAEVGLIENMAQTCSAIVGQFPKRTMVEPQPLTSDLSNRLRSLYAQ